MSGGGGGAPASVVRPSPSLVRLSVNDDVRGSAKDLSETELTVLNLLRELLANGANEGRAGWYSDDGDGDGDDARMLSLCSMMSQLNTFSGGTSKADDNVFRVALGAFGLKVEDLPPDTEKAQVRLAPYPSYRALFFSLCSAFGRPDDAIWTIHDENITGVVGHGHPATALRRGDVRQADLTVFVAWWWMQKPKYVDEKDPCTKWSDVPWKLLYTPVGINDRYVANTPRQRWVAVLKLLQLRGADFSSELRPPNQIREDQQLHRLFFQCSSEEVYGDEGTRRWQVNAIKGKIDEGARCGRAPWHDTTANPDLWDARADARLSILQFALSVQHKVSWPGLLDVVLAEGNRYGGAHIFESGYSGLKYDLAYIVYALGYVPQPEDLDILPEFLGGIAVHQALALAEDVVGPVGPLIQHTDGGKTYDAIHRVLKAYVVHYNEVVKKPPFGMPPCDDRPFYVSTHLEELIQEMRAVCAQLQAAVERLPDLDGATEGLRDATGKLDAAIDDTLLTHKDALERVRRRMGFSPPYYVPTSPAYDPCFPDYDRQPSEQDPWDVRDSRPSEASSSQQQQGQGQGQWEWP